MGFFDRLTGRTPQPIQLNGTEARAVFETLDAICRFNGGEKSLEHLKAVRRVHRPVLERVHRRFDKGEIVQGLGRGENLAVGQASGNWCGAWEPEGLGSYRVAMPEPHCAWVAMERVAHLLGEASICTACGNAIVPAQASTVLQQEFRDNELRRLAELLKAQVCSTCEQSKRAGEDSALEVQRQAEREAKLQSDAARVKAHRSATSGATELVRQEIEVLHDLLAIFYTPTRTASRADEYVEWWDANGCVVPDIMERLKNLASGPVLSEAQAYQLSRMLQPVAALLESPGPLLPAEIRARMQIGYEVCQWEVGDGCILCVLGWGLDPVLIRESYEALGRAPDE